jgi:hypothetical protein
MLSSHHVCSCIKLTSETRSTRYDFMILAVAVLMSPAVQISEFDYYLSNIHVLGMRVSRKLYLTAMRYLNISGCAE